MDGSCTVLVTSCDAYRDVEAPFLKLFRKYWPDCPFELMLLTETEKSGEADSCPLVSEAQGFDHVIYTGKGKTWSQMLVEALDRIETPYVIMLMNDYFLKDRVDTERIRTFVELAKRTDALNVRLNPYPPGKEIFDLSFFGSDLSSLPVRSSVKNCAYAISCQAGIWNRKFLRDLAAKTKSAWEFERCGSYMFDETDSRPLLVTEKCELPFLDAVHKGCWERSGVQCLRDNGIPFDLARRGLPSLKVRLTESLKTFVFWLFPSNWIVRVQNAFNLGAKEKGLSKSS